MAQTIVIRQEKDKPKAMLAIDSLAIDPKKPMVVTIKEEAETRRLKQNRLGFCWYNELGKLTGHGKDYERYRLKLTIGIPIVREDPEFNAFYLNAIDGLPYDQKLAAMEYVPVTRFMSVKQFAQYLTEIDRESAKNGYPLSQPDDLYWAALMKEAH